ncbi:MAG: ChuX/HutX family heme-like substrate-binding protein, partial [Pseudomonadota bacterium]
MLPAGLRASRGWIWALRSAAGRRPSNPAHRPTPVVSDFPKHWRHAFLVEKELENGIQRSVQVFDAAGDAVHKVFLRESSNLDVWENLKRQAWAGEPD